MEYKRSKGNICEVENVLSIFSRNRKKAINSYLEFMEVEDGEIKEMSEYELSPDFEEIEAKINQIAFDKKELDEIIKSFEQRYSIDIDDIKRKYLKGDIFKKRNMFIKEVLKYKALNQSELSDFLGVSHHLISKVWNHYDETI